MTKEDFLNYLKDPVAAGVDQAGKDFQERWVGVVDGFNISEIKSRDEQRHWVIQVFSQDMLLIQSFDKTLHEYIYKYNPSAIVNTGRYDWETSCFSLGLVI